MPTAPSLYDRLGGRPTLEQVHGALLDRMLAHPLLRQLLAGVPRLLLERQLSDFMTVLLGGPRHYQGSFPRAAHQHLYVTTELFELRSELLSSALVEAEVGPELREAWLELDRGFAPDVVKASLDDCTPRHVFDSIVVAEPPRRVG